MLDKCTLYELNDIWKLVFSATARSVRTEVADMQEQVPMNSKQQNEVEKRIKSFEKKQASGGGYKNSE